MAQTFKIAVIPGDGIGQEAVPEGVKVSDLGGTATSQVVTDAVIAAIEARSYRPARANS